MIETRKAHWERIYATRAADQLSWFQANPVRSRELVLATGAGFASPVIDVGGGDSRLADVLLDAGFLDLTVLDVSAAALRRARERLGPRADAVTFLEADVTDFHPPRRYEIWHDRAVFHFLTDPAERVRYVAALREAVPPGGHVILATFAAGAPPRCSGLDVVRYDPETLSAALGPGFVLRAWTGEVHRTPAGVSQPFLYCRFQVGA